MVDVLVVLLGLKLTVVREGCPLPLNWTAPLNPPEEVTVTIQVVLEPRVIVREAGEAESEKSDTAVTLTLAVPFTPPLDAVTVKGPPVVVPAVNKPDELMLPPLTVQLKVGCGLIG